MAVLRLGATEPAQHSRCGQTEQHQAGERHVFSFVTHAYSQPSAMPVFRKATWVGCITPSTHKLPPQPGPDALSLGLSGMHGVAQRAQVVVNREALPHVEGTHPKVAERGVLHRRAELRLQRGIAGGVHAIVLQPPGVL